MHTAGQPHSLSVQLIDVLTIFGRRGIDLFKKEVMVFMLPYERIIRLKTRAERLEIVARISDQLFVEAEIGFLVIAFVPRCGRKVLVLFVMRVVVRYQGCVRVII